MDEIIPVDARNRILWEITPGSEEIERQQHVISTLRTALIEYSVTSGHEYNFIEPQGSTGKKQTQLKGAGDIDLFVALDPMNFEETLALPVKDRKKVLDTELDAIVEDWFIPATRGLNPSYLMKTYSQHPYLSIEYLGTDVDILVCFDLSKEELASNGPITAVDRTVHHSHYVAERINEKLREDIRILKSFVRASHTYGDVCPVGQMGFTGYSLELLVIQHRGINNALLSLKNLHENPIDVENRSLVTLKQEPAFKDNHIFIIDPTDANRNVASSFSKRAYDWLRLRTIELIQTRNSDTESFINLILEKPVPTDPLPSWLTPHSFAYTFETDKSYHYTIVRDKLYRYARKMAGQLKTERTGEKRFGEILFEVFYAKNKFSLGFVVENYRISEMYSRKGPPVGIEGSERFIESHESVYEDHGYLWVDEKRRWINANDMVNDMIGRHNIKGLTLQNEATQQDAQVQNVLFRYVLPIEPDFPIRGTV
ncbi:MAG: hypothetical protein ACFFF4_07735 [Candidatus Thorarchaeota archaeon]